jgi:toxin ParE1/3/4
MKVIVSDRAEDDLFALFAYLQEQSPAAAEAIAAEIDRRFQTIGRFPLSGSSRDRLGPDIRVMLASPYAIFYAVRRDHVTILRILHGSRDVNEEFFR